MRKTTKNQTQPVYRTGPTAKPKGYGGMVALLLVLVILFGGLATLLGFLNIRLLETLPLPQRQEMPISFTPGQETAPEAQMTTLSDQYVEISPLGLSAESVTTFLQFYYDLPPGAYITAVAEGSGAAAAGCLPGDIILEVDGLPVADAEQLNQLLTSYRRGATVVLTLYRAEEIIAIRLIVE